MKLRFNHWLPKILRVDAITLAPYVFVAREKAQTPFGLLRHESEHINQVRRVGWISFYVSYTLYWLAGLLHYKSSSKAYLSIPYEVEARRVEARKSSGSN